MTTYQIHVREVGRAVRSMLVNVEADSPEEADDLFAEFGEDAGEVVEREVVDSTFDLEFDEVTSIVEAPEEGGVTMNDYTARKNLDRLFRALIGEGFATIQGNICCRNCAGHEIANEHEDGKPAAFYTEQDVEDGRGHPDHTNTYIGFGPVNGGDMDETRKVGERIVELADELCIPVEWDGSPSVRILVNPVE